MGLLSAIQTNYQWGFKVPMKETFFSIGNTEQFFTRSIQVGSLIDNDYLLGDLMITMKENYHELLHDDSDNGKLPTLKKSRAFVDFDFPKGQDLNLLSNSNFRVYNEWSEYYTVSEAFIQVTYNFHFLNKIDVHDFEHRPGNFGLPIFNSDRDTNLDEWKQDNEIWCTTINSVNFVSASVFASSFDLQFGPKNQKWDSDNEILIDSPVVSGRPQRQIVIEPKGAVYFKILNFLRDPFELAFTRNLFVLRSRFIRRGLLLSNIEYTQWYVRFELTNTRSKRVSLFSDDDMKNEDYRIFSFVVPQQPRILMYEMIGTELLGFSPSFTSTPKWTFDFIKRFDNKLAEASFMGSVEGILLKVFGLPARFMRVYRKEKPLSGEKRKYLPFEFPSLGLY